MKYFKYIVLSLSLSLTGCDFMDCDESSDYTQEDIWSSYGRTKQMVTHLYGCLPSDFGRVNGAMLDAATDDAVHVYESKSIQRILDGTWSANSLVDDVWGDMYEAIRSANRYLADTKGLDFKEWENSDEYETVMQEFTNSAYEVRFLRAFFYFELIKRYQNVPLIKDVLTPKEANNVSPSSYVEVANFIMDECTDIAKQLPVNYNGFINKETGRITKGTALALKSRVALYVASPLINTSNNLEAWKTAAKAAYELIGNVGTLGYKFDKYESLFTADNNKNTEVILCRPVGETGEFERNNFPMGVEGGKTSTCPTQNLMEAYETNKGEAFDWENPSLRNDPYSNRDPRMKKTIVINNSVWPKAAVEIWEGGKNGLPLRNATVTGYYLKKYLNPDINFAAGSTVTKKHHNYILFRYAEVLLNYAEAMVNAFGDPDYKDSELPLSACEAVNMVRARTGVQMPGFPTGMGAKAFETRLRNERRVELAFEGHRFWDMRRWKALDQMNKVYSLKIEKNGEEFIYTKYLYATRNFQEKMNFYPIPNTELFINSNLKQNTGW